MFFQIYSTEYAICTAAKLFIPGITALVCGQRESKQNTVKYKQTHTHTQIYIYIYVYTSLICIYPRTLADSAQQPTANNNHKSKYAKQNRLVPPLLSSFPIFSYPGTCSWADPRKAVAIAHDATSWKTVALKAKMCGSGIEVISLKSAILCSLAESCGFGTYSWVEKLTGWRSTLSRWIGW